MASEGPAYIESAMTFDDIKRYVASRDLEDPSIGNATLLDIRNKIQGEFSGAGFGRDLKQR